MGIRKRARWASAVETPALANREAMPQSGYCGSPIKFEYPRLADAQSDGFVMMLARLLRGPR